MKKFTLGILTGAILCLSVSALANFEAIPNAFPIKLNGNDISLEGYNINDSTYFKLRDVADAVGGFDVDFVDGTITIQSDATSNPTPIPTTIPANEPVASVKNTPNPKLPLYRYGGDEYNPNAHIDEHTFTSDGLVIETLEDGKQYVYTGDIETVYNFKDNGYEFGVGRLYKGNDILLDNIQIASNDKSSKILLSYYETTFLKWLQENCK